VIGLAGALALPLAASLVVAVLHPAAAAPRVGITLVSWAPLAVLLPYCFLPAFDLPGRIIARVTLRSRRKAIALTFDDGPYPETTPAILEALARLGVRATFFLVGEQARRHPELVRRIGAAGHAIGNHTQRHRLLVFRTDAEVEDEIAACQRTLGALGVRASLFRPPHGFKPLGLQRTLDRHGLRMVAWRGTIRDTDGPGVEAIAKRTLAAARDGAILLLHDSPTTRGQTAAALPAIAEGLFARGYRFVTPE
jgi:peptidoglycan/xylan/chitin deacetylase (PgdA/CDA1 family)